MTANFAKRVRERIGNVDPDLLAQALIWAIENRRDDLVQFYFRVQRDGRRMFRFKVPDGRTFFAIVCTETMTPLTVMPAGWEVRPWVTGRMPAKQILREA